MTDGTSGRSGTWRQRLAVGLGLLFVLIAAGLLATVPGELAEKRRYLAAPPCPESTSSDTCTTLVPATVVGKRSLGGRLRTYALDIVEQDTNVVQRLRSVEYAPVYSSVSAGDEVVLTYWRGEIAAVTFGSAVQQTRDSPIRGWRAPLGFGLQSLFLGLPLLVIAVWSRYHSPSPQQPYPWSVGCLAVATVFPGPIALLASREDSDIPEVLLATAVAVPVGAAVGALVTGWLRWRARWRAKRNENASDITPVLPTGTKFVPATVLGDVPYSQDFFDRLIVGEGRPAATPDRKGRVAVRKTLPETLTVQRVRAFRPDDPDHWSLAYKYNGVVLECRDGDRTVHIITRRRDAPLILGALVGSPDPADSANAGSGQPAGPS
ncbi:hypothetical protein SAMN05216266_103109 [Amycolatopsis marina]|uniref:Uncharacterized protein n=1 Tax=Amycolatopsis marina TaxID=490629 RepID=A0A1I0XFP3_9PSEU|nr:hypothetical protein [Amycolatopsis marina]SFA98763.1 hypothetical protein SAMN05216266_103109 [Amycolatopsis marina]